MTTAEVIVIGGGVNGASTLFHLAQAGVKNVVLVEQGYLAAGATGKSGALVRMHYTNPHETRLAYESLKIFKNWDSIVGGDCGYTATGFVQVVAPAFEQELRSYVAMQRAIGVEAQVISAQELHELEPACRTDDLSYVAMVMMSLDGRPIIDQVAGIDGLFVMVGDSGTSFKTSPAIGKSLAEWIVDGQPRTADLHPFRAARFAEDNPWGEVATYGRVRRTVSR